MTAPNIREEIRKLVELQELDKKIFDLSREKNQQPQSLETLQKEFETKKTAYNTLEENRKKLLLRQKEKEGELAAKEENIKKNQGQLGQLKTNKDYQAKLAEIESLKADQSVVEEEILKLMDTIEAARAAAQEEKKNVDAEEKIFTEKKNAVLAREKDIDAALACLTDKRKILLSAVDKKILERYEHILHGWGTRDGASGLALVKVTDNSCNGCFMKVTHQVINEIKMHERLITCETCSRILYLEEDLTA